MSRTKLAWVARIEKLEDIPGKDAIKYASLKDTQWQVITNVESTGLKEGDFACYVEYDTYLPADGGEKLKNRGDGNSPFEFLRKSSFSPRRNAFKVRPMKMAGLVSYGLLVPISDLTAYDCEPSLFYEGSDLTELVGAKQADDFELDQKSNGSSGERWAFPPNLSKTDEVRIEALSRSIYDELRGQEFVATAKIDGQSTTFASIDGEFYAASRNYTKYKTPLDQAVEELTPQEAYKFDGATKYAATIDLPKAMKDSNYGNFAVQGELCGPGIQKNRLGFCNLNFYVFNFVDLNSGQPRYLPYDLAKEKIQKIDCLRMVPEVWRGKFEFSTKVELKKLAEIKYMNGAVGEGIVLRSVDEDLLNRPLRGTGVMRSFKVINDLYAMKTGDEE